jgi:hypothetical protein
MTGWNWGDVSLFNQVIFDKGPCITVSLFNTINFLAHAIYSGNGTTDPLSTGTHSFLYPVPALLALVETRLQ